MAAWREFTHACVYYKCVRSIVVWAALDIWSLYWVVQNIVSNCWSISK